MMRPGAARWRSPGCDRTCGLTLTLEPGAVIEFPALSDDRAGGSDTTRSELIVSGSLVAVGTEEQPITFSSGALVKAKRDWYGIRVVNSPLLRLEYCLVEYATQGVSYERSGSDANYATVVVSHSTIQQTAGKGSG